MSHHPVGPIVSVRNRLARARLLLLAAALAGGMIAGGVAWATIPDSGGVIHGCYQTRSGLLRVIDTDADQACRQGETSLDWNRAGAAGAGGALAYAHVENDTLDAARSKNIVSMTVVHSQGAFGDNIYCFVVDGTPQNAVASGETINTLAPWVTVEGTTAMAALPCPAGTSAAVDYGGTSPFFPPHPLPFYVAFN